VFAMLFGLGCGDNASGGGDGDETGECVGETGEILDGAWVGVEDWTDPGAVGNETIMDACGWSSRSAHHCFTTAIHAVHMHTGEILMFHGERDQRVWKIGTDPDAVEWHPNLLQIQTPTGVTGVPDMFCSGHVQLADGRIFAAGGNISGNPGDGGLVETFIFDPVGAIAASPGAASECSFGWEGALQGNGFVTSTSETMQHDRWYPTLTMLRDGRILVAGGYSWIAGQERAAMVDPDSCVGGFGCACANDPAGPCAGTLECISGICMEAVRSGLLEVYDPTNNTLVPLTGALFPVVDFPVYPQMFLLPNGDVFYAGSEDATNEATSHGRFLVIDYEAPPAQWTWSEEVLESEVTGGSAVMYAPGVILKTGGLTLIDDGNSTSLYASNRAERIDLSGVTISGDYDAIPDSFPNTASMNHARHYHNLVVLPNGNVLAVGGNSYGNGVGGENPNHPCEFDGQRIDEMTCETGCPSVCVDLGSYHDGYAGLACGVRPENYGCSLLSLVTCEVDSECTIILADATCSGGRCFKACSTDADCGTLDGPCESGQLESAQFDTRCNPGNNACYATRQAEMYDPACDVWVELDAQEFPRMYHSSALLVPDGRVLSMGGGHRGAVADQPVSEYFVPRYSAFPNAPRPWIQWGDPGDVGPTAKPLLAYGGVLEVDVIGPPPARFTVVRLGASTHGFDQDQRFLELSFDQANGGYAIQGPSDGAEAPPGHYMLFAVSAAGQPSVGRYVRVGVAP
jgi:hypothetical protein